MLLRRVALALAFLLSPAGAPASAQTAPNGIGTFRIGILAEAGSDSTVQGLAGLKKAYTLALGIPVEFFVAEDYRTLIEAQTERRIDYAVYSATAYATAELACGCVSALVAPTAASGAIGMRSVLVARPDGPKSVSDLAGFRIAIPGRGDIAGRELPLFSLGREGHALRGDEPFFVQVASQAEAEDRLVAGEVDAMFGWIETGIDRNPLPRDGTLARLAASGGGSDGFQVVWTSELLRYGPHAISKDLDPEVRRRLIPFLTGLKDGEPDLFAALARHQQGGFVSVNDADYATAVDLARFISEAK